MLKANALTKILIGIVVLLVTYIVNGSLNMKQHTNIGVSEACSIDVVVGAEGIAPQFSLGLKSQVEFQGWFADAVNGRLPNHILIELMNVRGVVVFAVKGTVGVARSDVAQALKNDNVKNAGFNINSSTIGVASGVYDIILVGSYSDQDVVCRTNRRLQIK